MSASPSRFAPVREFRVTTVRLSGLDRHVSAIVVEMEAIS
jgi:hypothetical protein